MVSDLFLLDLGVPYLDESKLIVGQTLGTGSFGEVYKAGYKGKAVALKKLFTGRSGKWVSALSHQSIKCNLFVFFFILLDNYTKISLHFRHPMSLILPRKMSSEHFRNCVASWQSCPISTTIPAL